MNRKDKNELRLYRIALDWLHFPFSLGDFVGMTATFIQNFKDSEKDKALLEVMKNGVRQINTALRQAEALPGLYAAQKRDHAAHIEKMIAEWTRGCSVADHHSPWGCESCTVGLVKAIEDSVKGFAERDHKADIFADAAGAMATPEFSAPETKSGAKLFGGFDERCMPRFNESRPFAGLTPKNDAGRRLDGHNPPPDYPRPPTPPGHPRGTDKTNTVEISVAELKRLNAIEAASKSAPLQIPTSGGPHIAIPVAEHKRLKRMASNAGEAWPHERDGRPMAHGYSSSGLRMAEIPLGYLRALEAMAGALEDGVPDRITGLRLEPADVAFTSLQYLKALEAAAEHLTVVDARLDETKRDLEIERDRVKRAEAESRSLLRVAIDANSFCRSSLGVLKRYAQFPWAAQVANIDALVRQLDLSLLRQFSVLQPFYAVEAQKDVEDMIISSIDHSKAEYPS